MSYDTIQYEEDRDDMRVTITLDRPSSMNAISSLMVKELTDALARVEVIDDVRAVIITGAGDAFSAGYDLTDRNDTVTTGGTDDPVPSADDLLDAVGDLVAHLEAIWRLGKPVVAAVDGHCLAGGSDVALVCDIAIASEEATFGYPGQRLAGHPPALTYPYFMAPHHAKELLLTGKMVSAERACKMGAFNRVVPTEDLMEEVNAEVDAIKKVPGNGTRIQKHSINAVIDRQGFSTSLRDGQFLNVLAHLTEIGKEYYRYHDSTEHEGLESTLEWMNERDKGMRDVRDPSDSE